VIGRFKVRFGEPPKPTRWQRVLPRLIAAYDHFGAVAESSQELFAVLPAEAEFSDISKAESANNISEEISLGFVEVGVHHRALGPIHQLCLAEFAIQVVAILSATVWRVIMFRSRVG